MRPSFAFALVFAAASAVVVGCDGPGPGAEAGHDHAAATGSESSGLHQHKAPHGGSLVVLQDEALNLELLVDTATGALSAWVLDGECENPVRIAQETIELTLNLNGSAVAVRLDAVENALTGEKKGDTSQFAGANDGLRGVGRFTGVVRSVKVGPRAFQGVKFDYAGAHR
ncbi:MAG: hypothetical protein K8T90_21205 [Planctomycetes bacterium]|nr:hypothetical protein [Planctomycetota bacterium]